MTFFLYYNRTWSLCVATRYAVLFVLLKMFNFYSEMLLIENRFKHRIIGCSCHRDFSNILLKNTILYSRSGVYSLVVSYTDVKFLSGVKSDPSNRGCSVPPWTIHYKMRSRRCHFRPVKNVLSRTSALSVRTCAFPSPFIVFITISKGRTKGIQGCTKGSWLDYNTAQ